MVLNSLKSLSNELRIPVVAMGTQDAVRVLGNRFEPIGIPRWAVSREYAVFVARYVQSLELKQESEFRSKELVGRIHTMSEGSRGKRVNCSRLLRRRRSKLDARSLTRELWIKCLG